MVVLGVVLHCCQEMRANKVAEKLQAMVIDAATLARDVKDQPSPGKRRFTFGHRVRDAAHCSSAHGSGTLLGLFGRDGLLGLF